LMIIYKPAMLCYDDTWLIINNFRKFAIYFFWCKVLHELSWSKVYLVGKLLSYIIWSQLITILGREQVFSSDQSRSLRYYYCSSEAWTDGLN
jgi:hypothetical protein